MFGRQYEFTAAFPELSSLGHEETQRVTYVLEPHDEHPTVPVVNWNLPDVGELSGDDAIRFDEVVSAACMKHYRDHSGDYEVAGPGGKQIP